MATTQALPGECFSEDRGTGRLESIEMQKFNMSWWLALKYYLEELNIL